MLNIQSYIEMGFYLRSPEALKQSSFVYSSSSSGRSIVAFETHLYTYILVYTYVRIPMLDVA